MFRVYNFSQLKFTPDNLNWTPNYDISSHVSYRHLQDTPSSCDDKKKRDCPSIALFRQSLF
jgi:hypothetical protein